MFAQTVSYAAVRSRKSASIQLLLKTVLDVGGQGSDLVTSAPGFPETSLIWTK